MILLAGHSKSYNPNKEKKLASTIKWAAHLGLQYEKLCTKCVYIKKKWVQIILQKKPCKIEIQLVFCLFAYCIYLLTIV